MQYLHIEYQWEVWQTDCYNNQFQSTTQVSTVLTCIGQLQRRDQDVEEDASHESGEEEELRLEERVSVETNKQSEEEDESAEDARKHGR